MKLKLNQDMQPILWGGLKCQEWNNWITVIKTDYHMLSLVLTMMNIIREAHPDNPLMVYSLNYQKSIVK